MAIQYSVTQLKSPKNPDAPGKYYAKAQSRGEINLETIASDICRVSSLSDGDLINAVTNLTDRIRTYLSDGYIVNIEGLGKFQYHLSSEGVNTPEEFTSSHISKAAIRFRPGERLVGRHTKPTFQKVISLKERKAAVDRYSKQDV